MQWPQDLRLADEHEPHQQDGAEGEGEGAERDQDRDLGGAQALRMIGAVADHAPGEDRSADIVRERVGDEGAERDIGPGDAFLAMQMQQCDPVVPGECSIGDERREPGMEEGGGRDQRDLLADAGGDDLEGVPEAGLFELGGDGLVGQSLGLELVPEQVDRPDHGDEADQRPEIVEVFFHRTREQPEARAEPICESRLVHAGCVDASRAVSLPKPAPQGKRQASNPARIAANPGRCGETTCRASSASRAGRRFPSPAR